MAKKSKSTSLAESSAKESQKPPEALINQDDVSSGDGGISLDQLSQAWQSLLNQGDDPYTSPVDEAADPLLEAANKAAPQVFQEVEPADAPTTSSQADEHCEISPRTILEAILFVGLHDHRPIASEQIAKFMRGVKADEIDDIVKDLNVGYRSAGAPYYIESTVEGYRMSLREQFHRLREALYGRVKPARLSPAAVDVLSIVAYNQPVTAEQIEKLRNTPSGTIISQLVRRQLLRIERDDANPRVPKYCTTDRFLDLFGIKTLEDLPRGLEIER